LTIKIWKRSTDVDSMNSNSGPPPEQDIPLQVPKKTKLYVEQVEKLLGVV
jgi:Bardet-Biedl syndrome 1 protein